MTTTGKHTKRHIIVDLSKQRLVLFEADEILASYVISSAVNGAGEVMGSEQTPRGMHRIDKKIGEGAAVNTVFVGRKPTGEIWTPELAQANPTRDWIVTRILWLAGCESGINRGYNNEDKNVDSHERYIYLHGTPDPACLGTPSSHGCIRLANDDMIGLFDKVSEGTTVCINP